MENIKLTQYSRSAGCGCKIPPQVLASILKTEATPFIDKRLIVGNDTNDDAAVYQLNDNQNIISSTDFFMPIVDDPFTFGQIAAANALSDIYAMGGSPIMALAILGWPTEILPAEVAQQVLDGARNICKEANIALSGGHSIETTEPIFGLSVNGLVSNSNLKKNSTVKENDWLFLTKPLGIGILSTALKKEKISIAHHQLLIQQLTLLNKIGEPIGTLPYVNAMTDVTGFGIIGHLIEMCKAAHLSAEIYFDQLPIIDGTIDYMQQNIVPDATYRNWNAYNNDIKMEQGVDMMTAFKLLPDPQTNGGLLIAVEQQHKNDMVDFLKENKLNDYCSPIGKIISKESTIIKVKNK